MRFGAETCAKEICDFAILRSCFLEIVEGRATLFAPKAMDECILQEKLQEKVKGQRWKRAEEEKEQKTNGRARDLVHGAHATKPKKLRLQYSYIVGTLFTSLFYHRQWILVGLG